MSRLSVADHESKFGAGKLRLLTFKRICHGSVALSPRNEFGFSMTMRWEPVGHPTDLPPFMRMRN
jgi:hypothetical protein